MHKVESLVQLDDLDKLKFYEDYYVMLIELMKKRNKDASELIAEHQMLQRRIEELENR
jgi:hypothetical protein